jgi:G3E family GTPase
MPSSWKPPGLPTPPRAPVAQTFFVDEIVRRKTRLDAVVTVADAKWLIDRLGDVPEAKNQIAFADVILLNKTDLVAAEQLEEVEGRIRAINPYAQLHKTQRCAVALAEVLDRQAFELERILSLDPAFLSAGYPHGQSDHDGHEHEHGRNVTRYHDQEMGSIALREARPLNSQKFFAWIKDLVATEGPNLLRSKGILAFEGDPDRFVFQGVHMMLDGDHQRPWRQGESRESRIVFIGRNLPEDKIRRGFAACLT